MWWVYPSWPFALKSQPAFSPLTDVEMVNAPFSHRCRNGQHPFSPLTDVAMVNTLFPPLTDVEMVNAAEGGEAIDQNVFPKFLTSRKLLFLQMADIQFRRTILFQVCAQAIGGYLNQWCLGLFRWPASNSGSGCV